MLRFSKIYLVGFGVSTAALLVGNLTSGLIIADASVALYLGGGFQVSIVSLAKSIIYSSAWPVFWSYALGKWAVMPYRGCMIGVDNGELTEAIINETIKKKYGFAMRMREIKMYDHETISYSLVIKYNKNSLVPHFIPNHDMIVRYLRGGGDAPKN